MRELPTTTSSNRSIPEEAARACAGRGASADAAGKTRRARHRTAGRPVQRQATTRGCSPSAATANAHPRRRSASGRRSGPTSPNGRRPNSATASARRATSISKSRSSRTKRTPAREIEMIAVVERWFRRLSLAWKLNAINMFVGGFSMALACGVFAGYDVITSGHRMVRELDALAASVSLERGAGAAAAGDAQAADDAVRVVSAYEDVASASIILPNGQVLARFDRPGASTWRRPWMSVLPQEMTSLTSLMLLPWRVLAADALGITRPVLLEWPAGGHRDARLHGGGAPFAGARVSPDHRGRAHPDVRHLARDVEPNAAGDLAANRGSHGHGPHGDDRAPPRRSHPQGQRRRDWPAGRWFQRDDGRDPDARQAAARASGGPRAHGRGAYCRAPDAEHRAGGRASEGP